MKEGRMKSENRGECECFMWGMKTPRAAMAIAARGNWQFRVRRFRLSLAQI